MLTDDLLTDFADVLRDRSESDSPRTPAGPADPDVPRDVARLLSAVGGWNVGDLRFIEPSGLAGDRKVWSQFVADFEAGTSDNWSHAFWNPAWYPLAWSSTELYAYDPVGHFNGHPGQLVCFDFKGATQWVVFPSLRAWLIAFKHALEGDDAEDPVLGAHQRAASRHELHTVDLPEAAGPQRSRDRFRRPLVLHVDATAEIHDFTLYRLYALSRGRAPQQLIGEVARALDTAMPYYDVRDLERLELDDAAALARRWARPLLTQNASRRDVSRLFFGVEVSNQMVLWTWPCAKDEEPTIAERRRV